MRPERQPATVKAKLRVRGRGHSTQNKPHPTASERVMNSGSVGRGLGEDSLWAHHLR